MRNEDSFDSVKLTLNGKHTQESFVVQMHTLLSAFERGIDGSGPLIESQEVAGFRRELHASCSNIRDDLNRLSDGTLKLERAATKHAQRSHRSNRANRSKKRCGLVWIRRSGLRHRSAPAEQLGCRVATAG